jgi:hypothetical protein
MPVHSIRRGLSPDTRKKGLSQHAADAYRLPLGRKKLDPRPSFRRLGKLGTSTAVVVQTAVDHVLTVLFVCFLRTSADWMDHVVL